MQELPYKLVQWLLGEQLLVPVRGSGGSGSEYRLSSKGEQAAREAAGQGQPAEHEWRMVRALETGPLLLLRPAAHSEDLDHVLVLTMGGEPITQHRNRLDFAQQAKSADPEHFEFIQYRTDVFALPINNALIQQNLLPPEGQPAIVRTVGLAHPEELGARWCPDRGVNYGARYIQWFGGFSDEDPLIISPRLELAAFEKLLKEVEGHS